MGITGLALKIGNSGLLWIGPKPTSLPQGHGVEQCFRLKPPLVRHLPPPSNLRETNIFHFCKGYFLLLFFLSFHPTIYCRSAFYSLLLLTVCMQGKFLIAGECPFSLLVVEVQISISRWRDHFRYIKLVCDMLLSCKAFRSR